MRRGTSESARTAEAEQEEKSRKEWLREEEAWQGSRLACCPHTQACFQVFPSQRNRPDQQMMGTWWYDAPCPPSGHPRTLGAPIGPCTQLQGRLARAPSQGPFPWSHPFPGTLLGWSRPLATREPGGWCATALPSQRGKHSVEPCLAGREVGHRLETPGGRRLRRAPCWDHGCGWEDQPTSSSAQVPTKRQKRTTSMISPGVSFLRDAGWGGPGEREGNSLHRSHPTLWTVSLVLTCQHASLHLGLACPGPL